MKVGIKVGPEDGIQVLNQSQAKYSEVWFRLDWQEKYISLFNYLKKNKISFGLHFWATVDGRYLPDMLCLEKNIALKTFNLIKQTIDIASKNGARYVNFHPEAYHLNLLDLNHSTIKTLNPKKKIDKEKSFNQLLFYLEKIRTYAKQNHVIPFLETVPKYVPADFKNMEKGRSNPQKSEGLETEKFFELAKLGYPICLDIGHTIAQCVTNDKDELFAFLLNAAKKMLLTLGLVHVTTNLPPFNGTDSHNGVLSEDFNQGVFPNKVQLIKLLSLFKDKDIWLIPEPRKDKMLDNYLELKRIVETIETN